MTKRKFEDEDEFSETEYTIQHKKRKEITPSQDIVPNAHLTQYAFQLIFTTPRYYELTIPLDSSTLMLGRDHPLLAEHLDTFVKRQAARVTVNSAGTVTLESLGHPMRIYHPSSKVDVITGGASIELSVGDVVELAYNPSKDVGKFPLRFIHSSNYFLSSATPPPTNQMDADTQTEPQTPPIEQPTESKSPIPTEPTLSKGDDQPNASLTFQEIIQLQFNQSPQFDFTQSIFLYATPFDYNAALDLCKKQMAPNSRFFAFISGLHISAFIDARHVIITLETPQRVSTGGCTCSTFKKANDTCVHILAVLLLCSHKFSSKLQEINQSSSLKIVYRDNLKKDLMERCSKETVVDFILDVMAKHSEVALDSIGSPSSKITEAIIDQLISDEDLDAATNATKDNHTVFLPPFVQDSSTSFISPDSVAKITASLNNAISTAIIFARRMQEDSDDEMEINMSTANQIVTAYLKTADTYFQQKKILSAYSILLALTDPILHIYDPDVIEGLDNVHIPITLAEKWQHFLVRTPPLFSLSMSNQLETWINEHDDNDDDEEFFDWIEPVREIATHRWTFAPLQEVLQGKRQANTQESTETTLVRIQYLEEIGAHLQALRLTRANGLRYEECRVMASRGDLVKTTHLVLEHQYLPWTEQLKLVGWIKEITRRLGAVSGELAPLCAFRLLINLLIQRGQRLKEVRPEVAFQDGLHHTSFWDIRETTTTKLLQDFVFHVTHPFDPPASVEQRNALYNEKLAQQTKQNKWRKSDAVTGVSPQKNRDPPSLTTMSARAVARDYKTIFQGKSVAQIFSHVDGLPTHITECLFAPMSAVFIAEALLISPANLLSAAKEFRASGRPWEAWQLYHCAVRKLVEIHREKGPNATKGFALVSIYHDLLATSFELDIGIESAIDYVCIALDESVVTLTEMLEMGNMLDNNGWIVHALALGVRAWQIANTSRRTSIPAFVGLFGWVIKEAQLFELLFNSGEPLGLHATYVRQVFVYELDGIEAVFKRMESCIHTALPATLLAKHYCSHGRLSEGVSLLENAMDLPDETNTINWSIDIEPYLQILEKYNEQRLRAHLLVKLFDHQPSLKLLTQLQSCYPKDSAELQTLMSEVILPKLKVDGTDNSPTFQAAVEIFLANDPNKLKVLMTSLSRAEYCIDRLFVGTLVLPEGQSNLSIFHTLWPVIERLCASHEWNDTVSTDPFLDILETLGDLKESAKMDKLVLDYIYRREKAVPADDLRAIARFAALCGAVKQVYQDTETEFRKVESYCLSIASVKPRLKLEVEKMLKSIQ